MLLLLLDGSGGTLKVGTMGPSFLSVGQPSLY